MSPADVKARTGQPAQVRTAPTFPSHLLVTDRAYNPDETLLIRQAQAGHWDAFAELAGHYDAPILALALRITGSEREASKLFQTIFSRAYEELRGYRFRCSFYLWIHRIVVRSCIQFLQQKDDSHVATPLTLAQLSPRERMVFELKHGFGLRLETIAAILETSEAVARNIFLRAVIVLRLEADKRG